MSVADPDDDGRAASSAGRSATFEEIVADWVAEGAVPRWPDQRLGAGETSGLGDQQPRRTTSPAAGANPPFTDPPDTDPPYNDPPDTESRDRGRFGAGPRDTEPPVAADEGHYVPPEPPPMPRLGHSALVGLALLAVGLLLLVAPGVLGLASSTALPLGLLVLAGGVGWLVLRSWPASPPTDGDGEDDGAVL